MAKILNSDCISGTIQRVVETPLGYIINGIYYDKKTMTPKAMQTFPIQGHGQYLSMNQNLIGWQTYIHLESMGNTIVNDRYDSTISYLFTTSSAEGKTIVKIRENNGTINILNKITFTDLGNYVFYNMIKSYVGQDEDYIYVLTSGRYDAYNDHYYNDSLCKINKENLSLSAIHSENNSWYTPIKETNEYIYYGIIRSNGIHYIYRYHKITNRTEKIPILERASDNAYSASYSNLLLNSDSDFYTYSIFQDSESKNIKIVRYHFDTTKNDLKDICTEKTYAIEDKEGLMATIIKKSDLNIHYESFITTIDNKSYLNIAIYERNANITGNFIYYGIHTFEIDTITKDVTYKNFLNINDYFKGFLGVRNNTFLVGMSSNQSYFLSFEKDKFVITNVLANQPKYIGADLAENIWIVNGLNEVEMYSSYVPLHVNIEYEFENYDYEGKNINTYITVEAKNYSDLNISSKLKFTIEGNAVFSSNGENILIDTTLATGKKRIPITINGFGAITINAEMVL